MYNCVILRKHTLALPACRQHEQVLAEYQTLKELRIAFGLNSNFRANPHFLVFRWLLSTAGPVAPTHLQLIQLIAVYYNDNQTVELLYLDIEPVNQRIEKLLGSEERY